MGAMTIRRLDDDLIALLKQRAQINNRSAEAEVRAILDETLRGPLRDDETRREKMREFADWSAAHLAKLEPLPAGTIVSWIREDRDR